MDFHKNYYSILGISKDSEKEKIKKAYYKLSFIHHPDKGGDSNLFSSLTEAYDVLTSDSRTEYDKRSKFGNNYDETLELLNFEYDTLKKDWDESKVDDWKRENQLNVIVRVDDSFDGKVTYQRYLTCKDCGGSGKNLKSKLVIRDEDGNVLKIFDGEDGCDFCEGKGKDPFGSDCGFCAGKGKVGSEDCETCMGQKRILGNQTVTGIKFIEGEKSHKVEFMGNVSKEDKGKVGHLWILKESE